MHALSFNADISGWDVSSVTNAPMAFFAASTFRTDISSWNVTSMRDVTKMVSYICIYIVICNATRPIILF